MASVINLDTVRLTRNVDHSARCEPTTAEIILFPGIRYERWDEAAESLEDDTQTAECEKIIVSQE